MVKPSVSERRNRSAGMIDIVSYDELISHIQELDSSRPDGRLCFRGQVREHPYIRSAMIRHVESPEFSFRETFYKSLLWGAAAEAISEEHLPSSLLDEHTLGEGKYRPIEDPSILANARSAMVEGILQHYGFRTHFVDVTFNPDIALRFAHFEYHDFYPVFDGDPERPKLRRVASYVPSTESHGYLYVLDCVRWHPKQGRPSHGQVVDLTNLVRPGWNRVQMQQAMVIHSDPRKQNYGDLRPDVRAVYRFPIPLPGAEAALNETRMWFPGLNDDPIYRSLLESRFVEFTYLADHPIRPWIRMSTDLDCLYYQTEIPPFTEVKLFQRALDIPEYHSNPESVEEISLFRSCDRILTPTFFFPWLKERISSVRYRGRRPASQTPNKNTLKRVAASNMVLVNVPFGDLRNLGGAVRRKEYAPRRSNLNVFFEFSPFNFVGPYSDARAIRGVWIGRSGKRFLVTVFGTATRRPWVGELGIFTRTGRGYKALNRTKPDMRPHFLLALKLLRDFVERRAEITPLLRGSNYKQMRYPPGSLYQEETNHYIDQDNSTTLGM